MMRFATSTEKKEQSKVPGLNCYLFPQALSAGPGSRRKGRLLTLNPRFANLRP